MSDSVRVTLTLTLAELYAVHLACALSISNEELLQWTPARIGDFQRGRRVLSDAILRSLPTRSDQ